MIYSAVEMLVPIGIHASGAAFVIFLVDGPFYETLEIGQFVLSIRCGFISLSYGILVIHFVYRFLAVQRITTLNDYTSPKRFFGGFIFFLAHGLAWTIVCEFFIYGDDEIRQYIKSDFNQSFDIDSSSLPMLSAVYTVTMFFEMEQNELQRIQEVSPDVISRSWMGISMLTAISTYAVVTYIVLGLKIARKLKTNPNLSNYTKQLHKQLLNALAVQTIIPIIISFLPCLLAWYGPLLNIHNSNWMNNIGVIALSTFPFLDPVAIILLLSSYRRRVFCSEVKRAGVLDISLTLRRLQQTDIFH